MNENHAQKEDIVNYIKKSVLEVSLNEYYPYSAVGNSILALASSVSAVATPIVGTSILVQAATSVSSVAGASSMLSLKLIQFIRYVNVKFPPNCMRLFADSSDLSLQVLPNIIDSGAHNVTNSSEIPGNFGLYSSLYFTFFFWISVGNDLDTIPLFHCVYLQKIRETCLEQSRSIFSMELSHYVVAMSMCRFHDISSGELHPSSKCGRIWKHESFNCNNVVTITAVPIYIHLGHF
jgi:hypothetical protein